MPAHIEPALVAFDADGTPFSPLYGDIYHSADSGLGQAQHVFLAGNDLPRRWAGARVFTILETGFGFGLSFLATWNAWRADPCRCERLHFVSVEKHPFDCDALERVHAGYAGVAPLAAQLRSAWPPLVPGLHRLHFENERVTLTLAFGDVAALLPRLRLTADAVYLDGFAPARNPEMWSRQVMKGVGRLAVRGTTVATWSTAGVVREGLEDAGFALEKRPGFGRKQEMSCGRYAPRWPVNERTDTPGATARHAIVIGAGLAGAAVSERLASRGWRIELIERGPAAPVQNRFAGVFHPHVSPDDALRSRLARNGFLYALSRWRALEAAGHAFAWSRCGVLQVADDVEEAFRMAETMAALGYPPDYAQYVEEDRAESLCGCPIRNGGWWFPAGGWMRPSSLIAAQLAAAGASLTPHFGLAVHAIRRAGAMWHALAADGSIIASAPAVVLANAGDAARLAPMAQPLDGVRGQVTYLPAENIAAPRAVLIGSGYVLPAADGIVVTGSTYHRNDNDPAPRVQDHEENLARLAQLLPRAREAADASRVDGAVGFRCVVSDHMPLAGAIPQVDTARIRQLALSGGHLGDVPRDSGLYCVSAFASRGLVWAALAGETVASMLEGEPLPLESDLADALDPARFVLRQARHGTL